jgi:hypothetical protein
MVRNSRIYIDKFNGQIFELWNFKIEDLLVDKGQWVAMDPDSAPMSMLAKY